MDVMKILHREGVDFEKLTKLGTTCLSLAQDRQNEEVIDWLSDTFPAIKVALSEEKWGDTAQKEKIILAASEGDLEKLKEYIEDGAPVNFHLNSKEVHYDTPL